VQDILRKVESYSEEKRGEFTAALMFPTTKEQIVARLKQQGAPDTVIERAEKLPDKKYENIGELVKAAGK